MTTKVRNNLFEVLLEKSRKLNKEKLAEVLDFVEFLADKDDEEIMRKGIQALSVKSRSLKFLTKEPNLYSLKDIKSS